jgi:hypothetical protein
VKTVRFFLGKLLSDLVGCGSGRRVIIIAQALDHVSSVGHEAAGQRDTFGECSHSQLGFELRVTWFGSVAARVADFLSQGIPVSILVCEFTAQPQDKRSMVKVK